MATEEVAMTYALAAVERAMKVYEVLVQALKERQPWIRVAEGQRAHRAALTVAV